MKEIIEVLEDCRDLVHDYMDGRRKDALTKAIEVCKREGEKDVTSDWYGQKEDAKARKINELEREIVAHKVDVDDKQRRYNDVLEQLTEKDKIIEGYEKAKDQIGITHESATVLHLSCIGVIAEKDKEIERLKDLLCAEKCDEEYCQYGVDFTELQAEIERLKGYKGYLSASGCPLCKYEKGKFIEACLYHQEYDVLHKLYSNLQAELKALKDRVDDVEGIFKAIRYTCVCEKCDETCPGFKGDCGVRKLAKSIQAYLKGEL